jgi:GNAT superfamily N-acetyltransferase
MLDFREAPVADIAYFGLMPEYTGLRLGSWLLLEGIHDAWDTGVGKLTVNTCTLDHPSALPLYRKMGFRPVRTEDRTREVSDA